MKILFTLTPAMDPNAGGIQRTTYKLGKYFTEQDYSVSYYSAAKDGHIDVEYGRLYSAPQEGSTTNKDNIKDLRRVIKQIQPDIVINQMPYDKELLESLASLKDITNYLLLGCLRNSLFNFKKNVRSGMWLKLPRFAFKLLDHKAGIKSIKQYHKWKHGRELRAIIDKHDRFILLSPPNKGELEYFVGHYKDDKILSVPNSIPSVYDDERQKKEKVILYVGRLDIHQKRSDLLIDFWQECHQKVPDWKFVIVGDGPYLSKLRDKIKAKKLPRINLEGFQKPESYYKRASVFVMTSAFEGFPNVLLEAQSYGLAPVVFNSYAALNWITESGKNAVLVEPYNVEQMGRQVAELTYNYKKLELLQEAARKNARRFTIDTVGKQWEELFTNQV